MKKYVVIGEFLDRFSDMKHFKLGDTHEPPNEERAKQLLVQGFIKEEDEESVKEDAPSKQQEASTKEKSKGKGKGKSKS